MIFPRALGYVDAAVTDLFDRLDKRITPIPAILAETFRSLSACQSTELAVTPRRDKITIENWMMILQNLKDENYKSRQFIPATQGLAQSEFSYKDDGYKKKI
ncbi:hypothetical protein Golob_006877 [Gossypium lobatum]|uniref:Uncharacterized protein n=1 Tax=Gossypium lobatum TaxID=34289 RepID=A0A7J8NF52_9ROSI|nr:hypothetical protein [Gossypium lobatum]